MNADKAQEELEQLYTSLRDAIACGGALGLCTEALRWCRAHRDRVRRAFGERGARALQPRVRGIIKEHLGAHSSVVTVEDWDRIRRGLEVVARPIDAHVAPMIARSLAESVDELFGDRFAFELKITSQAGGLPRRAGDPIPVARPDLPGIFGSLGGRAERLEDAIDWVKNLILMPEAADLEVRLHFPEYATLGLAKGDVVAGALSLQGLCELESIPGSEPGELWMRPKNPREAAERVQGLLEKASALEIVVCAELNVDRDGLDRLESWARNAPALPSVVLLGSAHLEGDGRRQNQARLIIARSVIRHEKFAAFVDKHGAREPLQVDRATLHIVFADRWSLCPLVCKDLLERSAYRTLADLQVGMVLVAACSPSLRDFEKPAAEVASRGKGVVVIANHTEDAGEASFLIVQPSVGAPTLSIGRGSVAPPCLASLSLCSEEGQSFPNVVSL